MLFSRRRSPARLLCALLWLSAQAAWGAEPGADDARRWTLTPYLWLPTINSDVRFDFPSGGEDGSVSSEIGPNDYLTNLNGVLMLAAEFRREQWAFSGDLIWLDLTTDASTIRSVTGGGETISIPRETILDTSIDLSGVAVTLSASRLLVNTKRSSAAVLGGVRYFTIDTDLHWSLSTTITGPGFTFARQGKLSGDMDLYDAIVGARGKWQLGDGGHWYIPWYADVGTGSSDLTWQAMAGIGYSFTRSSLLLVWRQLEYDLSDDDLLQEIRFGGPGVGFSWRF